MVFGRPYVGRRVDYPASESMLISPRDAATARNLDAAALASCAAAIVFPDAPVEHSMVMH
jgi:hypothetical protein